MTSDDSIYRPPESPLDVPAKSRGTFGSLERGLAGDFEFQIGDVLSEAWELTRGSKAVLMGGVAAYFGVSVVAAMISLALTGFENDAVDPVMEVLATTVEMIGTLLCYPIMAGMFLYVIKRAVGDSSASFGDIFGSFERFFPIVGLMLLEGLLVLVGLLLFVLPGIYLGVAYTFALPLMLEKDLGIWEALETSRKAVGNCWFRCLGLGAVCFLILLIGGGFTAGVGLIWFIPLASLSFGVLYRNMFGYEAAEG